MSEIRPMRAQDIPEVADLYRFVDKSDWRIPPEELPTWLKRTLFECPWAHEEIPSLVYVGDSGAILGFVGANVRRMRFEGEPILLAAAGPLIAHPDVRSLAVGARLWRHFLMGGQQVTITDGASDEMRGIFEMIGGQLMHPSSMAWARIFKPWSFVGNRVLGANVYMRHRVKPWARRLLPLLDAPTTALAKRFRAPQTDTSDVPLTPELLLEHLPTITRSLRLVPDYDVEFLQWMFAELHNNRTWGTPCKRLVYDGNGRAIGWYVYFALPHEGCQVIQLAAQPRHAGSVLDNLFAHAVAHGGAAVQGRVEAHILVELAHRGSLFRYTPRSLVHSKDPLLLGAITSGHALLTRMEGEWVMAT